MYYIYMLRCEDNSIYTGITNDMKRRWEEHHSKDEKGAKYTKGHSVLKIEALWTTENRKLASKLEYHIKHLQKEKKEELIKTKDLKKYLSQKIECENYQYMGNKI